MKKRLTIVMAVVCCLALMVGSLALFTAQAETSGTAKAGNLNVAVDGEITADLKLGGDDNIANSETLDNWNPGDSATFGYEVSTTGTKAIRYQETITLTVEGVDEAAIGDAMITIDGTGDADPDFATESGKYTITYVVAEGTLDGTEEDIDGTGCVTSADKEYTLKFAKAALNEYQDAEITVDVDVVAVQFANTANISEYAAEPVTP